MYRWNSCGLKSHEVSLTRFSHSEYWAFLTVQTKKKLPAMQTWVQSLSCEDPLEKRMATHSSILAWRIPWTEEPGGLKSIELLRVKCE